jgi:hypothetical protein
MKLEARMASGVAATVMAAVLGVSTTHAVAAPLAPQTVAITATGETSNALELTGTFQGRTVSGTASRSGCGDAVGGWRRELRTGRYRRHHHHRGPQLWQAGRTPCRARIEPVHRPVRTTTSGRDDLTTRSHKCPKNQWNTTRRSTHVRSRTQPLKRHTPASWNSLVNRG